MIWSWQPPRKPGCWRRFRGIGLTVTQAIFLGLVQGVTEFLPVSSSGHLLAIRHFLGADLVPGLLVEVALHVGTLAALVVVFRRDLTRLIADGTRGAAIALKERDLRAAADRAPLFPTAVAIIVGSVPAALAGVMLKSTIEVHLTGLMPVGMCLTATGCLLLASRWAPEGAVERVGPPRGLAVGMAQAIALLPGVSRSGSTIVAARFLGVTRQTAARFSFLLAAPVVAGAAALEAWDMTSDPTTAGVDAGFLAAVGVGAFTAMVTGVASLALLMRIVRRGRLHWFAAYCMPAGVAMMLYALVRG